MKKQTKILIAIVAALVVIVAAFALLNRGNAAEKQRMQTDAVFKITQGEKTLCEVNMADLQAIGLKQIQATMDTSTTDATAVTFTAVQVKDILAYKKVSLTGVGTLEFKALDGYASAVSIAEIQQDQNVFICTQKDGKNLGTKAEAGMGPYLMIIKSSQFSQRWCKFVAEIVLK